MIWKNPFLIKNHEQRDKEQEYLALFDSTVLQIIEDQNFEMASYVSSTPGAGKTSLFRAFSPEILNIISEKDNQGKYDDIVKHMMNFGIINEGKVTLLSAMLSCARGYDIIEEMFENGRRKQVLFALLNYRIAMAFLRSICTLLDIGTEDLKQVTFEKIPDEMLSEEAHFSNAYVTYQWACKGEKELCRYLDSSREEQIDLSFVHLSLLVIKLFEGSNIIYRGQPCFEKSLLILDDFHKLTASQKKYVSETVYTLKSRGGVWFGQRLEGVSNQQVISLDGSLGRAYAPNIVIDNYWSSDKNRKHTFECILSGIADRRVREAGLNNLRAFSDCMADELDIADGKDILTKYVKTIKESLVGINRYFKVTEYIDSEYADDIYTRTLYYECLKMLENRKNCGQLSLDLGIQMEADEINSFYSENKAKAKYYVCFNCGLPYYYGIKSLKYLSSYNIEQFLYFSAEILEGYRIKTLGTGKNKKLSAQEQNDIIKSSVLKMWDDMDYRYSDIEQIRTFLSNIADWGIKSRKRECGSYDGGAYTGFAVSSTDLMEGIHDQEFELVINILGKCLASKYLERRDNDKREHVVFYLNRWLCVYFGLPLAYGGWKKSNMRQLKNMCLYRQDENTENQLSLIGVGQ